MNAENRPMGTGTALALPSDARELRDLATFIATSRLIPQPFQKSPADCWMVMDFCRVKKMNFFATIQHCHIIKNNLFFDGQLCGAMLNTSGFLAGPLNHEFERNDKGDAIAVITSARLLNEATPRVVRVELENVKTNNTVWTTQPEQQLGYSGNRIWGRRHLPEVLLGMTFDGEPPPDVTVGDIVVRDAPPPKIKRTDEHSEETAHTGPIVRIHDKELATRVADKVQDSIDTQTRFEDREKAEPCAIPLREETVAGWSTWAITLMAYIRAAPDLATVFQWKTLNEATLARLQERSKITHTKLTDQIDDNIAMRREQDDAQ